MEVLCCCSCSRLLTVRRAVGAVVLERGGVVALSPIAAEASCCCSLADLPEAPPARRHTHTHMIADPDKEGKHTSIRAADVCTKHVLSSFDPFRAAWTFRAAFLVQGFYYAEGSPTPVKLKVKVKVKQKVKNDFNCSSPSTCRLTHCSFIYNSIHTQTQA